MNAQLSVGWLAILLAFVLAAGIVFAAARSAGAKPVSARRVVTGLSLGTVACYAMFGMLAMILWIFAIVIDFEWLPDRYFVWIFQSLMAPWHWFWSFV